MQRLRRLAGVDIHVVSTLLARGWNVLAGALTVVLVPLWLSVTEQGYYFTFLSLLGLQIVFELGLGQVIVQLVSHEMAALHDSGDGRLSGEQRRLDRLTALMRMLRRWYRVAAVLFAVIAGALGAAFLDDKGSLPAETWLAPWLVMVACTAVSLTWIPALALVEGSGRVGDVARVRLAGLVVGYLSFWLVLVLGGSLWGACLVPLCTAAASSWWVARHGLLYRWLLERQAADAGAMLWRRDVLPLQWRIALSAASGYLIFYAFTPLVFARQGAAEAGRFGLAMAVFNAVAVVGTSWVYASTPKMAMHVARGERRQLDAVFKGVALRSLAATAVLALCIVAAVVLLNAGGFALSTRVSATPVVACLAAVAIANSVVFSLAAYMRAHCEEPMLGVSVFGAVCTLLIGWFASAHSMVLMASLYALLTLGVVLPWCVALYLRYRRRPASTPAPLP